MVKTFEFSLSEVALDFKGFKKKKAKTPIILTITDENRIT